MRRKQWEEILRRSEERYRGLFENATVGIFQTTLDGEGLNVNPAAAAILGYESPEHLRQSVSDPGRQLYVDPAERDRLIGEMAISGTVRGRLVDLRRADGSVVTVRVDMRALPGPDGRVAGAEGMFSDVTGALEADRALAEARQRLEHIVAASPAVLFTLAPEGRGFAATWVSGNLERLLGWSVEEALAPGWWVTHLHPLDRERMLAEMKALGSRDHLLQEYRFQHRKGHWVWIRGELRQLRDAAGEPVEIVGSWADITDRKEAEIKVEQAATQYRLLFENNPEAMVVVDPDTGRVMAVNEAAVRRYGWSREEFLWLTVAEIRADGEPVELEAVLQPDAGAPHVARTRHRTKDDRVIDVEVTSTGISFQGRPAVLALAVDVTESTRALTALQDSERKYRELFVDGLTGNYVSTVDGWVLECNPAFLHIFGFSSLAEAQATNKAQLYQSPGDRDELVELVRRHGRVVNRERLGRRLDGSPLHLVESVIGESDGGELVKLKGFLFDDTARRALEEQLRQAQKMEAIGRLAGGVAHDFNNLLGVILAYAEMVLAAPGDTPKLEKRVGEIRRAAERATALTRQLLVFSRKQVVQPRVLDLNAVVLEVQKLLQRLIGEDVELVVDLAPELGMVLADEGQLDQVLMNLAVNARDAMPQGGRLVIATRRALIDRLEPGPDGVPPGRYAELCVRDEGQGMDDATQARIFEPFFTTKPEGKGTGLGLPTVYGIVRQSGGFIRVESVVGRGTTFRIYLPERLEPAPAAAPGTPAPRSGTETILLVEDADSLREVTREVLEARGYTVLATASGEEALRLIAEASPPVDLLLTDVVMPGMNGPALARQARAIHPTLHVLFMSGYTDQMISQHGLLEAGTSLVEKPFTAEQLHRRVREALDS